MRLSDRLNKRMGRPRPGIRFMMRSLSHRQFLTPVWILGPRAVTYRKTQLWHRTKLGKERAQSIGPILRRMFSITSKEVEAMSARKTILTLLVGIKLKFGRHPAREPK